MTQSSVDEVAKTCIRLLLKEPFYGHYMSGVPKEMTEQVPTAAVCLLGDSLIKLRVNPDFWASLSDAHRYGLIKHEVLHIVLRHLLSSKDFSNKSLYNIAADLVVNQYIDPAQLPEGGITLKRFYYLENKYGVKLETGKDVGYYYQKLDGFLKENSDGSMPNDGGGKGSLMDLLENGSEELERHKNWREFDKMSPGDAKILEHQLNNALKTTTDRIEKSANGYGTIPADLVEKLRGMLQALKPKFDWRRMLRLFAASSNSSYLKNTLRRPSKRYGTSPGVKLKRRHKLLLAIDTSGSIPIRDLEVFYGEIYHIWRQGAEITVVECDSVIQKNYLYRGQMPTQIHGRGGTDFSPPIAFANQELNPDAIIYFTDGYAPPPNEKSRYPILWVITSDGLKNNSKEWQALPGQKVQIEI